MSEDVSKTVLPDDVESDKITKKLLSDGGEIEFTVKGEKKKAYWENTGFEQRPFIKAYAYRRIRQAEEDGLLVRKSVSYKTTVHDNLLALLPTPSCLSTVVVNGHDKYTYNKDVGCVFFDEKIDKEVEVIYETYDEMEEYEEIYHNAIVVAMIFYSVKAIGDHKKKAFESIGYVGSLQTEEIADIMGSYAKNIKVSGEELKKSPGPQDSEKEDVTPSVTD